MMATSSKQEENRARFDKAAATWEEKPLRVALAAGITNTVRENIPLATSMQVLEYGCGTGMISRALSPFVHTVTAVDTSPEMLSVLRDKASEEGLTNITTALLDLSEQDGLAGTFDLIVSSMTFHHVADYDVLSRRLLAALRPGGYLAVADLAPEDGSFHDDNSGVVHFGIDPETLISLFKRYGAGPTASLQAHVIEKNGRSFPVLFTWCQKQA